MFALNLKFAQKIVFVETKQKKTNNVNLMVMSS